MHLGLKQLAAFFEGHRDAERLVLATVVETAGSTYRKAGAMMLFAPGGAFAGLISGGCLEDDLAQHAQAVFDDGVARRVSYDLHDDDDLLFGLGLGCGGDIHLLLQALDRATGFGVLPALFDSLANSRRCQLALALDSTDDLPLGANALRNDAGESTGDARLQELLGPVRTWHDSDGRCRLETVDTGSGPVSVLLISIEPPPRVLLCGGGPDAVPLAAQVAALGWDCLVTDHRPAYADARRFPSGVEVLCLRPGELATQVDLGRVNAAVVMSHHLEHDAAYLGQLDGHDLAYLGLLGPAQRRRQLAARLGPGASQLHGPAGLDIGAELPESIALSIMAEIHARLNSRDARPLGVPDDG